MNRKTNWDFLKAVLMLFVVYGHVCPADPNTWNPTTRITGLFVMPLFFFVSGYFQTSINNTADLLNKYRKTVFRIIIPQVSWGAIYVFLCILHLYPPVNIGTLFCVDYYLDIFGFLKYIPYYIAGFYWFLTALIMCVVVGSVMSLIISYSKLYGIVIMSISPVFFCFLSKDLYHFSFVWLFYDIGMIYKNYESYMHSMLFERCNTVVSILLTVVVIVVGAFFYPEKTFYYASNLIRYSGLFFVLWRFCLYILASFIALYWIMALYNRLNVSKWMISSGRDTLFVYCSHMLIVEFVYKPIVSEIQIIDGGIMNDIIAVPVGIALSLVLYIMLVKLCNTLKHAMVFRRLLMGER